LTDDTRKEGFGIEVSDLIELLDFNDRPNAHLPSAAMILLIV
jgi:hypothetical protein